MLCNMLDLQIQKLKYATVLDTKLDNFSAYSILDKNLSWNLPLTNLDFKNRYISGQLIGTPLFRIPFTSFSIYSFTSENIYGPQILWTLLDFRRIKKPSPLLILQYPFFPSKLLRTQDFVCLLYLCILFYTNIILNK